MESNFHTWRARAGPTPGPQRLLGTGQLEPSFEREMAEQFLHPLGARRDVGEAGRSSAHPLLAVETDRQSDGLRPRRRRSNCSQLLGFALQRPYSPGQKHLFRACCQEQTTSSSCKSRLTRALHHRESWPCPHRFITRVRASRRDHRFVERGVAWCAAARPGSPFGLHLGQRRNAKHDLSHRHGKLSSGGRDAACSGSGTCGSAAWPGRPSTNTTWGGGPRRLPWMWLMFRTLDAARGAGQIEQLARSSVASACLLGRLRWGAGQARRRRCGSTSSNQFGLLLPPWLQQQAPPCGPSARSASLRPKTPGGGRAGCAPAPSEGFQPAPPGL